MEPIRAAEVEAIDSMLNRYTQAFELDELNEDPEHEELYDRVSDAHSKVRLEPAIVDPEKLKSISEAEAEGIQDLIEALLGIFKTEGISFDEMREFRNLCTFYKRLKPDWEMPTVIEVGL